MRPRTEDEKIAIVQMSCVRFPVASWDKRFYRSLCSRDNISDREAPHLWRIFIKYRRQIKFDDKGRLLSFAELHCAPDFRRLQAASEAQRKIDELKAKYAEAVKG